MATITKENIGLLHEKLQVTIKKEDYLPGFEKALKDYSKKANMPGFRKGQVPAGLIKKMYGSSVFTDEILRSVDRELIKYLEDSKLDIFAQPLPLEMDLRSLNANNPEDYTFSFEIGMKPEFRLPEFASLHLTMFKVTVTDEMVESEVERLQNRYGNLKDLESVSSDENVINVNFSETDENGNEPEGGLRKDNSLLVKYFNEEFRKQLTGKQVNDFVQLKLNDAFDEKERDWIIQDLGLKEDASASDKHFKMVITKIGLLEKRELNEEFFNQLYPGQEIKTETDFRQKVKQEIESQWKVQSRNHLQHEIYHALIDSTQITFPESFLKKWIKTQGDTSKGVKTDEQVEHEFPGFLNQLKWTLITDRLVQESNIEVTQDDLKAFAKQQLLGYMGMQALDEEQEWVSNYIDRMMKDRKYVEDSYHRLQTQKIFEWVEQQAKPAEQEISVDDFAKLQREHEHHQH